MTPPESPGGDEPTNVSNRFDRVPATAAERTVPGRPTRAAIVSYFAERFGIDLDVFAGHTFWERGNGKIWIFAGDLPSPVTVEGLGLLALRTRQEHWKPTLEFAQRFGRNATRNCIDLDPDAARTFLAGEDQDLSWDGDWGYLIVTREMAGASEPLGVGLYVHGELRSMVPKGRRREL